MVSPTVTVPDAVYTTSTPATCAPPAADPVIKVNTANLRQPSASTTTDPLAAAVTPAPAPATAGAALEPPHSHPSTSGPADAATQPPTAYSNLNSADSSDDSSDDISGGTS
ncbi:uncharacterized protein [Procambarus clarkii]|uniref:uncharacterized protein n=1 Tax=Procambarus clarkii TaxID=6728 RepID=UPI003743DA9C